MNAALRFRRPELPLERACPPIQRALKEFEQLLHAGKELEAARAWRRVVDLREAFQTGIAHGEATR